MQAQSDGEAHSHRDDREERGLVDEHHADSTRRQAESAHEAKLANALHDHHEEAVGDTKGDDDEHDEHEDVSKPSVDLDVALHVGHGLIPREELEPRSAVQRELQAVSNVETHAVRFEDEPDLSEAVAHPDGFLGCRDGGVSDGVVEHLGSGLDDSGQVKESADHLALGVSSGEHEAVAQLGFEIADDVGAQNQRRFLAIGQEGPLDQER